MFEFGVSDFKGISDFKCKDADNRMKPILLFQGEHFEFSEKHKRMKNLFIGNSIFHYIFNSYLNK